MRPFNKIFGIGISRTGTSSLAEALTTLGIRTMHWPRNMGDFCSNQALVDITVACRFKELDQIFPGSLFIYTERSSRNWLTSVRAHYHALGVDLKLPDGQKQFAQEADVRIYGTVKPIGCDFMKAYDQHARAVTKYFANNTSRLLRMDASHFRNPRHSCWIDRHQAS